MPLTTIDLPLDVNHDYMALVAKPLYFTDLKFCVNLFLVLYFCSFKVLVDCSVIRLIRLIFICKGLISFLCG